MLLRQGLLQSDWDIGKNGEFSPGEECISTATLQPGGMWVEEPGMGSGLPRVPHQVTWVVSLSSSSPCFSVHPHLLLHSPSLPTHHSSFMPSLCCQPCSDAFLPLSAHTKPATLSLNVHSGSTSSESLAIGPVSLSDL